MARSWWLILTTVNCLISVWFTFLQRIMSRDHYGRFTMMHHPWATVPNITATRFAVTWVLTHRGPDYDDPKYPQSIPLGYIPQVEHTYAYYDGNYAIMNEHQLMFGECTDGTKIQPDPVPGKLIFYSTELSRVAAERCTKTREAVELIGQLIETYGYYGTGETLPIADTEEGWVIEMAPSPEGKGGLWVARKVPDGEVFVAANELRIREIDPDDPDMLFCKDLHAIAKKAQVHPPGEDEQVREGFRKHQEEYHRKQIEEKEEQGQQENSNSSQQNEVKESGGTVKGIPGSDFGETYGK